MADSQKQEVAQTFTRLNAKLRDKIADLLANIELVMKKNAEFRAKENELARPAMTGAVPKPRDASTPQDPELKEKTDNLIKLNKMIYKQQKLRQKIKKNIDEVEGSFNLDMILN